MNGNETITDTHAHLCDSIFESDRAEVIERAGSAGIKNILCVGEDLSDADLVEAARVKLEFEKYLEVWLERSPWAIAQEP